MKIKTSDLIGPALDYCVAVAEGHITHIDQNLNGALHRGVWVSSPSKPNAWVSLQSLPYSTSWAFGGPIIGREKITWTGQSARICRFARGSYSNVEAFGPTPLIAAMRCYVASKLGDEVEVPDELLET